MNKNFIISILIIILGILTILFVIFSINNSDASSFSDKYYQELCYGKPCTKY